MSRLTEKKFLDNFKAIKNISPNYVASKEELMYEKLGKLEDLEEELGCPLEVVLKAVKKGKVWNGYTWLLCMKLTFVNDYWVLSNGVYSVLLENYAKDARLCDSWWLKEDKSK